MTRTTTLLLLVGAALYAAPALALPQFAVRSARACDTCHVDPTGWEDPAVEFRKCSLNCNTCHVSPSGAGMRNAAGLYYGRQTLPMFGSRPADVVYRAPELSDAPAGSQPMASGSQPASSQPASSQPMASGSQPVAAGSQPASSQPMAAGSQPYGALAASQPAGPPRADHPERAYPTYVPAAGTAGRYGGIAYSPDFQIGADLRLMTFVPVDTESPRARADSVQIFPMQADVYLAYRPYNPEALNEGRLTLLLNTGFLGARATPIDGIGERFFLREYYAMYHDLPYQAYVRAGRFLPAWGWKTDDHTPFVRQGQLIFGQPFDHERQVTGVEVGVNPNYLYAHFSLFNAPDHPMTIANLTDDDAADTQPFWTTDGAYGAALAAGWRDLGWQLGGGIVYGNRGAIGDPDKAQQFDQVAYSAEWSLNFDVLTGALELPLIYLGQYTLNHQVPERGRNTIGLAAMHEVDYLVTQGVNVMARYDWSDNDIDLRFDSRHRLQAGVDFHPITYLELNLRYRHNWSNSDDRFKADADELVFIVHGWY